VGRTDRLSALLALCRLCLAEGLITLGAGSAVSRTEHFVVSRATSDVCRTERLSAGDTRFCVLRTKRLITHLTTAFVVGAHDSVTDSRRAGRTIRGAHFLSTVGTLLKMCFCESAVTDITACCCFGTVVAATTVAGNCVVVTACRLTRRTLDSVLVTERILAERTLAEVCCTERL
jgi:hypothetical protein